MLRRTFRRTRPVALEIMPVDPVSAAVDAVLPAVQGRGWLAACRSGIRSVIALPALWSRRRCESYQLLTMDHRDLRDMGLSSSQGYDLGNRPFWRP